MISVCPELSCQDLVRKINLFLLLFHSNNVVVSKVVDNPRWCAPESMFLHIQVIYFKNINNMISVIKKSEYDEKSDVYSFGIILWEVY